MNHENKLLTSERKQKKDKLEIWKNRLKKIARHKKLNKHGCPTTCPCDDLEVMNIKQIAKLEKELKE